MGAKIQFFGKFHFYLSFYRIPNSLCHFVVIIVFVFIVQLEFETKIYDMLAISKKVTARKKFLRLNKVCVPDLFHLNVRK